MFTKAGLSILVAAVVLSWAASPTLSTGVLPDGRPPDSYCGMLAYVVSGGAPDIGEYLAITQFSYGSNAACGESFTVVYTTMMDSSCGTAETPGPSIATYAVPVGSIYEVTDVDGSCLTLCRCN